MKWMGLEELNFDTCIHYTYWFEAFAIAGVLGKLLMLPRIKTLYVENGNPIWEQI